MSAPPTVETVVPVRGLPAGKARLARLLTVDQRNRLVRAMLDDVVRALLAAERVGRITIISRDAAARREAERLGVAFLHQSPERSGLNAALHYAQDQFREAPALLIVPADVPLVRPNDVDALIAAAGSALDAGVSLAPSEDGGTNGLCLRPPTVIPPAFGPDSAARHERDALDARASFQSVRSERWALDVDWPEDLARFVALAAGAELETLRCLRSEGFPYWGSGGLG